MEIMSNLSTADLQKESKQKRKEKKKKLDKNS